MYTYIQNLFYSEKLLCIKLYFLIKYFYHFYQNQKGFNCVRLTGSLCVCGCVTLRCRSVEKKIKIVEMHGHE